MAKSAPVLRVACRLRPALPDQASHSVQDHSCARLRQITPRSVCGQTKRPLLEPPHQHAHAIASPPQHLKQISAFATKHEDVSAEGITSSTVCTLAARLLSLSVVDHASSQPASRVAGQNAHAAALGLAQACSQHADCAPSTPLGQEYAICLEFGTVNFPQLPIDFNARNHPIPGHVFKQVDHQIRR